VEVTEGKLPEASAPLADEKKKIAAEYKKSYEPSSLSLHPMRPSEKRRSAATVDEKQEPLRRSDIGLYFRRIYETVGGSD